MDIKEIAQKEIIALGLVPAKAVLIDKLDFAWNEEAEFRVTSEPTKPEGETQFGPIGETTLLGIHAIAAERQEAQDLAQKAARAVYEKFEELELNPRQSGIYCITRVERNTLQFNNEHAFHSFVIFNVLHRSQE